MGDDIWAELEDIAYQDYVFEEMIKKEEKANEQLNTL